MGPSHIRVLRPAVLRISESITVALSPFAPRKPRSFAERKATLVSAPVLIGVLLAVGPWNGCGQDAGNVSVPPAKAAPLPPAKGASLPPAKNVTFSVATYNINFGNVDLRETLATIRKADADLVLLQETNADSDAFFRRQLGDRYRYMQFRGHLGEYSAERFGILANHPIEKLRFYPPERGIFGFWIAETDLGGRKVEVVNVHLQPVRMPEGSGVLASLRAFFDAEAAHAAEIRNVHQHLTPDVPTLVAGDFNSMAWFAAPQFLISNGFSDSFAAVTDKADAHPTWRWRIGNGGIAARIDFIFHTKHFRTRESRILESNPSDHLLLVSRLEWQADGSSAKAKQP